MLNDLELEEYFKRHNLTPAAIAYIHSARDKPSRMIGEHATSNVCAWRQSNKTNRYIGAESYTAERAFTILEDENSGCLELWDQCPRVYFRKHDRNGRSIRSPYTPDYISLRKSGPVIIECKHEKELIELCQSYPKDWINEAGGFRNLPAEAHFQEFGFDFKVFAYTNKLQFHVQNLTFLIQSRDTQVDSCLSSRLAEAFEKSFFWSMCDLKDEINLTDYVPLFRLIDQGKLFFNSHKELLSCPTGCYLVQNAELLGRVGDFVATKIFDGEPVQLPTYRTVPSEPEANRVLQRLDAVKSGNSNRSIRRWKKLIKEGEGNGLNEFQSLISKYDNCGNNLKKIPEVVDDYLIQFLLNDHAKSKGINLYRSYIRYSALAKEIHPSYEPVVRTTFKRRLESLPKHLIAFSRGGKRLSNAARESTDPEQRALTASLPWQRCAIDHYCADIYLVFFDDGQTPRVMRPWVTAMIDLATHRVVAYSISFRSPSRRSLCMVMRDCVRRHGRLPSEIIFDRGSEFKSVYFFSLLGHYRIDYMLRPASFSKYGGEVESLFRDFKTMWLCQRDGNLADYKEARAVDGKYKPSNCAVMSIRDFYVELDAFIHWRDSRPRVGEIESPMVSFIKTQEAFPFVGVKVEYDGTLMLTTSVETQDYSINYQRGIFLNGRWYFSPDIKKIKGKKSELSVRIDPENPCLIYGLIDKRWVNLSSNNINRFSAYDLLTQRIQGLLVTELYNEQRKIKQESDEVLVKIIRDLSESKDSHGKAQFAEITVSEESEELTVFEKLKGSTFRTIEPESWEVGNVFNA